MHAAKAWVTPKRRYSMKNSFSAQTSLKSLLFSIIELNYILQGMKSSVNCHLCTRRRNIGTPQSPRRVYSVLHTRLDLIFEVITN